MIAWEAWKLHDAMSWEMKNIEQAYENGLLHVFVTYETLGDLLKV